MFVQILVVYKHTYITTERHSKGMHNARWISTPYDCYYSTSIRIFCLSDKKPVNGFRHVDFSISTILSKQRLVTLVMYIYM